MVGNIIHIFASNMFLQLRKVILKCATSHVSKNIISEYGLKNRRTQTRLIFNISELAWFYFPKYSHDLIPFRPSTLVVNKQTSSDDNFNKSIVFTDDLVYIPTVNHFLPDPNGLKGNNENICSIEYSMIIVNRSIMSNCCI